MFVHLKSVDEEVRSTTRSRSNGRQEGHSEQFEEGMAVGGARSSDRNGGIRTVSLYPRRTQHRLSELDEVLPFPMASSDQSEVVLVSFLSPY